MMVLAAKPLALTMAAAPLARRTISARRATFMVRATEESTPEATPATAEADSTVFYAGANYSEAEVSFWHDLV